MFKKLVILFILASLSACHVKSKVQDIKKDEVAPVAEITTPITSPDQNFQAVENQQQADALNKAETAKEEEVEVQDRVFFAYDSSEVSEDAKKILDTQALWLKSDASIKVSIEGHCDEKGTREYNIALGDRRASATKNYLVKTGGIDASRIKTISYGKERLAYFGTDESTIAKNRRTVTVVAQ